MVMEPSLQLVCSRAQEVVPVAPTPIEVEADDSDHETSDQVTTKPRRTTRTRTASEWYGNPVLDIMFLDNNEPTSYGEAMVGPYSDKWLEAMKSEINGSLRRRWTWTVMLPSMKLDLWQRVFPQVQGVDYDEIFSSVAMLKVRRIHVSISCIYEIWQMDVKTSFLTGFREERLYAIQSEKFCRS